MPVPMATFTTKLGRELKNVANANFEPAELMDYVNEGVRQTMREIATRWPQYWLRTDETQQHLQNTIANQANYDLPDDFFVMVAVWLTDGHDNREEINSIGLSRTGDAAADGYFLRRNQVWIYPAPTALVVDGLELEYVSRPPDITDPSDDVPLSDDFEDEIRAYAAMKAKNRQEEHAGGFAAFHAMVNRTLKAMMAKTNVWRDGTGMHVRRRNFI